MDMEEIRRKRMEELKMQHGGGAGGGKQQMEQQQQQQQQRQDMMNSMLTQILTQDARARLNSIALVKPEKAEKLKTMLCQMAQAGQLQGKMSDQALLSLLEKISKSTNQQKTSVKFDRRRVMDSSDEDDY